MINLTAPQTQLQQRQEADAVRAPVGVNAYAQNGFDGANSSTGFRMVNFDDAADSGQMEGDTEQGLERNTNAFEIGDWTGYPSSTKPKGPFRVLDGEEYEVARKLANKTNANIHARRPDLAGMQIHEIHPVKFGGSPTDIDNKIALSPKEHARYTAFWNRILRERQKGNENEKRD